MAGFGRVRGRLVAVAAVVATVAAGGVVGYVVHRDNATPPAAAPPPGSDPARPESAWLQTLAHTGPDGTLDMLTALQAFSLAIGPVPGVQRPPGADEAIPSGTVAVTEVLRHFAELSDEQRAAVVAALDPAARPSRGGGREHPVYELRRAPAAPRDPVLPCQTGDSAGAAQYRATVDDLIRQIAMGLGRQPDVPVYVVINPREVKPDGTGAKAYTYMCHGTAEKAADRTPVTGCTVHMNPVAVASGLQDGETRAIFAHELGHCFLSARLFARSPAQSLPPPWFTEGAATWIMTQLAPSAAGGRLWTWYLNTPTMPLFRRAYSGVGFFAHLAETGADVWHLLDPMTDAQPGPADPAGWNRAAWQVADPGAAFLDSWGSGFAQGRYPGTAWTSTGPGLPAYLPALPRATLADGGTAGVSAEAAGTALTVVHVDAQIVQVSASAGAHGRISLGGGADATFPDAAAKPWCTLDSSQCRCPGDSAGNGTEFGSMAGGDVYVSVAGGLAPATVALAGQSREEFCKTRKPGRPGIRLPDQCPGDGAVSAAVGQGVAFAPPPLDTPAGDTVCIYEAGASQIVIGFGALNGRSLDDLVQQEMGGHEQRIDIPGADTAYHAAYADGDKVELTAGGRWFGLGTPPGVDSVAAVKRLLGIG
jgi:hypothetical protein